MTPTGGGVIDADRFMRIIFGEAPEGVPIVCQGPDSMAWRWVPGMDLTGFTHWCISTVRDAGRARVLSRKRENLVMAYAVMLDDVGTKVSRTLLEKKPRPAFRIETSAGNEQWIYRLKPAVAPDKAVELMRALAAAGFTDPGACKPAQLARLPESVKTGRDFAARVLQ